MIGWIKTGRTVNSEGTTITYSGVDTNLAIESRKRHIPHANRAGAWDHTSYFVLKDGKEVAEKWSLRDAKVFAETLMKEGKNA